MFGMRKKTIMPVTSRPLFPPDQAFVVQFADDEAGTASWCGRVEHVVSGRSLQFEGSVGLFASIAKLRRDATKQ
jgi:hypothetical protein